MANGYKSELDLALVAAKNADKHSLDRFLALDLVVETKPDHSPVTDADREIEKDFRKFIAQHFPDDLVVGEEFGSPNHLSDKRYWVIDPIDGTKNFLRGTPIWATLIALIDENKEVVVGVVSAPALKKTWFARKGFGAYLLEDGNERKIAVSKIDKLEDVSLSYSDLEGWGDKKQKFLNLQDRIWRTRAYGDFWSHLLVAQGAVDVAVEPALNLWDMAALDIIVREAGGKFTDLSGVDGPHGKSGISTNGLIHAKILSELN